MDGELAEIDGGGEHRRIEVRRLVDAPIQRVWEAITTAEAVAEWWDPGEIEAREGGRVRLGEQEPSGAGLLALDGEVKVCLPPHLFAFTWNPAYRPAMGLVRFDLVELGHDRTRVTLVHLVPVKDVLGAAVGWHELMDRLREFAGAGRLGPPREGREAELYSAYKVVLGTG